MIFKFCPNCKSSQHSFSEGKLFQCQSCGFTYFHNSVPAVAAIIKNQGKIMFFRRNKNPAKGKFDFPGGFLEHGENLEETLAREIKEELGVSIVNANYLFSFPNKYFYKGIDYEICDAFFSVELSSGELVVDQKEASEVVWLSLEEVDSSDLAFESVKKAVKQLRLINAKK